MAKSRRKRPNPRLVKIHRSYTVDEAARVLQVHKNTVRHWIRTGLPVVDKRKPALLHGLELRKFLEHRSKSTKRPCRPGELYCVKCREPKRPAGAMADYLVITATIGNLRGICPDCDSLIHRRVSRARISESCGDLDVTFPETASRIRERNFPSLDCDSEDTEVPHEQA